MLTRLKVSGFKNLIDVDVRFGPFTCIAGANGVGKSNLFDAITFLSALADRSIMDAAMSVRDEGGHSTDIRSLFHRTRDGYDDTISFVAEMIISPSGLDDLGQHADASITVVSYSLKLRYHPGSDHYVGGQIQVEEEELAHINIGDARERIGFPMSKDFKTSAIAGRRTSAFISSVIENGAMRIKQHQEGGQGRPKSYLAATLPRTVLSRADAAESPTALLVRNEMRSWRLLQLEPSALRAPDSFTAPSLLGANGSHLPATLYRLGRTGEGQQQFLPFEGADATSYTIFTQVANRLAMLLGDVREVWVDRDDKRDLFTLYLRDRTGAAHPARALSDGTLRFLALTTLSIDPHVTGVLCLEEPENGIHPARIPAMLDLLKSIAVDTNYGVDEENPLRQVIINTHSPEVVKQIDRDDLLIADEIETVRGNDRFPRARFRWVAGTWRAQLDSDPHKHASLSDLLAYLNPVATEPGDSQYLPEETESLLSSSATDSSAGYPTSPRSKGQRVIDMPAIQAYLWPATHRDEAKDGAHS